MKGSSASVMFKVCLFLWVMMLRTSAEQNQQINAKVMRTKTRRDDLYCKEEVINVTASGGALHSPRYPGSYPRNLMLSWKLLSPPGARVQLEFDGHFGLEDAEHGVCKYDYVTVEDQSETSTIIWGRWCGKKAPPRLTAKFNMLRVVFKSDDYFVAKPGFKVYYSLLYDAPPAQSQQNWNPSPVSLIGDSLSLIQEAQPSQSQEAWYPSTDSVLDDSLSLSQHVQPSQSQEYWHPGTDSLHDESLVISPDVHQSRQNWHPSTDSVLDDSLSISQDAQPSESQLDNWYPSIGDSSMMSDFTPGNTRATLFGAGKVPATVSSTGKVAATVSSTGKVPATVSSTGKVTATVLGTGKVAATVSSTGKVTATVSGYGKVSAKGEPAAVTEVPFSLDELDHTVAYFDTVEQLMRTLNPDTWKVDLQSIYSQTHIHYRSRAYFLSSRHNKVDLDRLYDDVKRYSCTPRNYSVNLREELRATSAVFFPRCLLVTRCGGNCGCGTQNWNNGCTCQAAKMSVKLHEVLKYAPEVTVHQRQRQRQPARLRWVIDEIFLTHHDKCECACPSRPPR